MQYKWLDEYLMSKKGVTKDFKEEWQWTRYMIGNKMFLAVCRGANGADELITLKLTPQEGELLRSQYKDIMPGYYMNKLHWNSVKIGGCVPDDLLQELCDKSYGLVFAGLTKKLQKQICEN